jgi:hypothetical protein
VKVLPREVPSNYKGKHEVGQRFMCFFFKANVYLPGVVIQNQCCIFLAKPQEWSEDKSGA